MTPFEGNWIASTVKIPGFSPPFNGVSNDAAEKTKIFSYNLLKESVLTGIYKTQPVTISSTYRATWAEQTSVNSGI